MTRRAKSQSGGWFATPDSSRLNMETQEYHTLRAVEDTHWWFRSLNEHAVRCLRDAGDSKRLRLFDAGVMDIFVEVV